MKFGLNLKCIFFKIKWKQKKLRILYFYLKKKCSIFFYLAQNMLMKWRESSGLNISLIDICVCRFRLSLYFLSFAAYSFVFVAIVKLLTLLLFFLIYWWWKNFYFISFYFSKNKYYIFNSHTEFNLTFSFVFLFFSFFSVHYISFKLFKR